MDWLERISEKLLGLDRGFFSAEGELHLHFDPHWPGPLIGGPMWLRFVGGLIIVALLWLLLRRREQNAGLRRAEQILMAVVVAFYFALIDGALAWNLSLAAGALFLVFYVYRREGRSPGVRISLGVLRSALIAFVLMLLNNPVLTRIRTITEPSVVAVLVDVSQSMQVRDIQPSADSSGPSRLEGVVDLLTGENRQLLNRLAKVHTLRIFTFDQNAHPLGVMPGVADKAAAAADPGAENSLVTALQKLEADGASTQVVPSILTVLDELQGQRLAGVVVITDGRDTPSQPPPELAKTLESYGIRVYPIAVGSDQHPHNIEVQSVAVQDSAFKGDIVNVRAVIRATGYEANHPVRLKLTDKRTGLALRGPDGRPVTKTINLSDDRPTEQELLFKPDETGSLTINVEAEKQAGEVNEKDNALTAQVNVLDAQIAVLYVEGYPRWEYRYVKNEMIRDKTVDISCLLTSADPTFAQEGDPKRERKGDPDPTHSDFPGPLTRFPESVEELKPYDVILFGDVDPRQFTDRQLQLISDFVSKMGGGFGMIAGPHWSPIAYRNTPIESILPVAISRVQTEDPTAVYDQGFRPVLTREGSDSSIFRFFADRDENDKYLKESLQPLFWYCRGVIAKPAIGIVLAEHPSDIGPDGHKAPLLVVSQFGAGRTLFSAFDDSWRWRFYTGESVFDTYWVEQLRYLARGRLGKKHLSFVADRQTYELGHQVRLRLAVMDANLLQQLPAELLVQVRDHNGQVTRVEKLQKQPGQNDYTTSFAADRVGHFSVKLPPIVGDADKLDASIDIIEPRLELSDPRVDRASLALLARETAPPVAGAPADFAKPIAFEEARAKLPGLIQSAAKTTQIPLDQPLWNVPAAMVIFMLLLTAEWVLRKAYGML